jgi:hypothetical protein
MGRGTKSGQPVNSSRVQERKQKNLKTDRRGLPPITKGYGGSLAVRLKHDPTSRTRLPQHDGGGREREPGRVVVVGGSPVVAGSSGAVSKHLRWYFSAALDSGTTKCGRERWERSVLREFLVGDGELDRAREGKHGCLGGSWWRCESVCRVRGSF